MTWQYIAGFFDGEGWVSKAPKPERCLAKYVIGMGQATHQGHVLVKIAEFMRSQGVRCRSHREHPSSGTQMDRLIVGDSASIVSFITAVMPHLLVKHEKCAVALVAAKQCMDRINDRKTRVARALQMKSEGASSWEITKATNVRPRGLYYHSHKLEVQQN